MTSTPLVEILSSARRSCGGHPTHITTGRRGPARPGWFPEATLPGSRSHRLRSSGLGRGGPRSDLRCPTAESMGHAALAGGTIMPDAWRSSEPLPTVSAPLAAGFRAGGRWLRREASLPLRMLRSVRRNCWPTPLGSAVRRIESSTASRRAEGRGREPVAGHDRTFLANVHSGPPTGRGTPPT